VAGTPGGGVKPMPAMLLAGGTWAIWGTCVGIVATRTPSSRFSDDNCLTRLRKWENDGLFWRAVYVHKWKGKVPELGGLFGGTSKRHLLPGKDGLERLARETRRAEVVHWVAPLPVVVVPFGARPGSAWPWLSTPSWLMGRA
jgi:glycosyl-4,4'-diaponeurosporenoate acyltransferase